MDFVFAGLTAGPSRPRTYSPTPMVHAEPEDCDGVYGHLAGSVADVEMPALKAVEDQPAARVFRLQRPLSVNPSSG
jgi:hypothetical protein